MRVAHNCRRATAHNHGMMRANGDRYASTKYLVECKYLEHVRIEFTITFTKWMCVSVRACVCMMFAWFSCQPHLAPKHLKKKRRAQKSVWLSFSSTFCHFSCSRVGNFYFSFYFLVWLLPAADYTATLLAQRSTYVSNYGVWAGGQTIMQ